MYDTRKFRDATSKKEQCKVDLHSDWEGKPPNPKYKKSYVKEIEKEYHKYCPKSKSNNYIFCPKRIIKKRNDEKVQWINDYFKNFAKKSKKKKKYKRKNKKKTSAKPAELAIMNRIDRMTAESTELANSAKSAKSAETAESAKSAESAESAK